jgi:phosphoribosylamine---glycine ligase
MRFLGIGDQNDLGALYYGLQRRGHEVRVYVGDEASRGIYRGMLDFCADWQQELGWLHEAGSQGIAIFESANYGTIQDELRRDGFQVVGGSALGDRLEADRDFGQQVLRGIGMSTARSYRFTNYCAAIDFLQRHAGRYVLKFNGATSLRTRNYIGELEDGADMRAVLALYNDLAGEAPSHRPDFVLMEYIEGIEVGVGAYFNGNAFLDTPCIDFEHKRFFPDDLGELTGEMGTVVSYRGAQRLFNAALAPLAGLLKEGGYCGYINCNLIANEDGLWPLEFTSRFGYPGFAICEALHAEPWEDIFLRLVSGRGTQLATHSGFAAGVVLTVPPFPYSHGYEELSKGQLISFRPSMCKKDRELLHFAEVELKGSNHLITSGTTGYIGVACGTGNSIEQASAEALCLARKVVVPNLRFRTDIGQRVAEHKWATLARLGWVADEEAAERTDMIRYESLVGIS